MSAPAERAEEIVTILEEDGKEVVNCFSYLTAEETSTEKPPVERPADGVVDYNTDVMETGVMYLYPMDGRVEAVCITEDNMLERYDPENLF